MKELFFFWDYHLFLNFQSLYVAWDRSSTLDTDTLGSTWGRKKKGVEMIKREKPTLLP